MSAFMAPAGGGGDLIKAAMAARGMPGGSPLAQMSPSVPGANPMNSAQPPAPMPQKSPMAGGPPPGGMSQGMPVPTQPMPGQTPGVIESPQEKLIITALSKQLERLGARNPSVPQGVGGGDMI